MNLKTGEDVVTTVRREIAEEVGIVVEKITYFDSQTWPLPQNSLMLAFTAVAMPGSEKVRTLFQLTVTVIQKKIVQC